MNEEPVRASQPLPEDAASAQAALERYVVRESPVRDFLAEKLRQMPWWTISFLVHVIVLLILWQWPYAPIAECTVPGKEIEIGFADPPPVEPLTPDLRPIEPSPVDDSTDLHIPEAQASVAPSSAPAPSPNDTLIPAGPPEPVSYSDFPPIISIDGPPVFPPPDGGGEKKDGTARPFLPGQVTPGKITIEHHDVIRLGLIWLGHAQERDGRWDAARWEGSKPYSVGCTGLALLAYLSAGSTTRSGEFKTTVARGIYWLRAGQTPDGKLPYDTFYEQGIATMALAEAYALTDDPAIRQMAQRGVDYICRVQPDHGGFRYSGATTKGDGDTSVTGWQIMAMKSSALAGLNVPKAAFERSRTFLAGTWRGYGKSAYTVDAKDPGSLAISSVGMLCRIFVDRAAYDDEVRQAAGVLLGAETRDGSPVPGGASGQLVKDLYYTYYSSLAMYQAGQEHWRQWRAMTVKPICDAQVQEGRDAQGRTLVGSWDPANCRWGKNAGRVYTTAMALLSLEVPYHYLRVNRKGL